MGARCRNEVVEAGAVALLQDRQNIKVAVVAFPDAGFTPQHGRTVADDGQAGIVGVVPFAVPEQD